MKILIENLVANTEMLRNAGLIPFQEYLEQSIPIYHFQDNVTHKVQQ